MTEQTFQQESDALLQVAIEQLAGAGPPVPPHPEKSGKLELQMIASVGSLGMSKTAWSCGGGFGR